MNSQTREKRIIGIILFLFFGIVGPILFNNISGMMFISPTALFYILITSVGLTLMQYRKGQEKTLIVKSLKKNLILCGVIGFLMGVIIILFHLENPSKAGPAFGVALLPIFYGLILSCLAGAFAD